MTWALPAIAGALLVFAMVSGRLAGTPLTAPIAFTVVGLLLGTQVADVIDPPAAGEQVKLLAEITLGLVLFADASRVNITTLRSEISIPERLLGIGLPLTMVAGFGAALFVLGDLGWPEALLLAVILAPTDAALGQAVVILPSLPSRIRQGLNVESGLNDGICVPVFLVVLAIAHAESGAIGGGTALRLVAEQIGYGALVGAGAGLIGALIIVVATRRGWMASVWEPIVPVSAAALGYTAAVPLGGSGFIAAFVGGLVFGAVAKQDQGAANDEGEGEEDPRLIDQVGDIFSAVTFIVFGAVLLGPALTNMSWTAVAYAVLSLTVIRMVPVALSLIKSGASPPTVGFLGWFGPRGLATIVFIILILEEHDELPNESLLITTAVLTVGLSILLHGVTAAPLADRYARWTADNPQENVPKDA